MNTILIADDDIVTRKLIKTVCENLGYKVIECDNGQAALKAIKRRRVHILITDWIMPKLDGLTLCEEVRKKSGHPLFVFLLTGKKKGLNNYTQAMKAGANDFIYKPVDYFVIRNQLQIAERELAMAN